MESVVQVPILSDTPDRGKCGYLASPGWGTDRRGENGLEPSGENEGEAGQGEPITARSNPVTDSSICKKNAAFHPVVGHHSSFIEEMSIFNG
jgi:hypothetical protein